MLNISSDVIRGYNDTMILYLLWEKMVTLLRLQTVTLQVENAGRITGLQMQGGTITG